MRCNFSSEIEQNKQNMLSSMAGSFISGSEVPAMSKEKETPGACVGGCGSVVWFTEDAQLRGPPRDSQYFMPVVSP